MNSTNPALKYKFGGKEYQDELGLGWYDITARNYDPALGRWMNLDPLAEAAGQIHNSPYAYGMNNPVFYNDPDGNCPPGVDCAGIILTVLTSKVKQFFGELIGDAQTLAASGGTDSQAATRLQEKSETLSTLSEGMDATVDFAKESVEMLPYGEALSAVGEGVINEDMEGALTDYAEQQVEDVPYAAAAAVLPVSKKALKRTKHTVNRHITRSKYPNKSKYKKPSQQKKLENRTMKTEGTVQNDGRVRYDKDFGREVGTNGETSVRVIVDPKKKKVVTSFPQK